MGQKAVSVLESPHSLRISSVSAELFSADNVTEVAAKAKKREVVSSNPPSTAAFYVRSVRESSVTHRGVVCKATLLQSYFSQ